MIIALIKPPLVGHNLRGTGIYLDNLYKELAKIPEHSVYLIDYHDPTYKYDIIHYPYFDPFFLTLPIRNPNNTIVTVHDLIPIKFPKLFPKGLKGLLKWHIQRRNLKKIGNIITDSFASKSDISNLCKVSPDRIHVIPLGVSDDFRVIHDNRIREMVRHKYKLPEEYLLYVGDINRNKNISNLIYSFSDVLRSFSNLYLVMIGKGLTQVSSERAEIEKLIGKLDIRKKVITYAQIPLNDLVGIYNLAKIYIQPSLAEGFGLPVLEAMKCGVPVIASDIKSLKEIAEDAAFFTDTGKPEEISRSVIRLLTDEKLYREVKNKGIENVKKYRWEQTVSDTLNVYKKCLL